MKKFVLNKKVVTDVLDVVDQGLSCGLGEPTPGRMCVEAAVCYALGLPHDDDPQCVHPVLRELKIRLNDQNWGSNKARARGLRRLAIMQLGTKSRFAEKTFRNKFIELFLTKYVPRMDRKVNLTLRDLRKESSNFLGVTSKGYLRVMLQDLGFLASATLSPGGEVGMGTVIDWYIHARDFASQRSRDRLRAEICEDLVQILASMNVPATKFLKLTEK